MKCIYVYIHICVFLSTYLYSTSLTRVIEWRFLRTISLLLLTLASGDSEHGPTVFLPVLSFQSVANRFLNGCCPFGPLLSVFSTDADRFTCLALIFISQCNTWGEWMSYFPTFMDWHSVTGNNEFCSNVLACVPLLRDVQSDVVMKPILFSWAFRQ